MRRYRTRTTAWPAVADLMTALAVVGLACALLVASQDASPGSPDVLQARIDSLKAVVDTKDAVIDSLKAELAIEEIGFQPCWRGHLPDGPTYYFTYNVTVLADTRLSVEPHEHWREESDLRGSLAPDLVAALLEYPADPVGQAGFMDFGTRIATAVASTGDYEPDCELAVTVNREATVAEAAVVRHAGFYPVGRE